MVGIVLGGLGKGKTSTLIDRANDAISKVKGTIVYLDTGTKHMFELNNQIRLINVREYPIIDFDVFVGFICGILSQDHDLEELYCDKYLNAAVIMDNVSLIRSIHRLEELSEKYQVNFILGVMDTGDFPEELQKNVIIAL